MLMKLFALLLPVLVQSWTAPTHLSRQLQTHQRRPSVTLITMRKRVCTQAPTSDTKCTRADPLQLPLTCALT